MAELPPGWGVDPLTSFFDFARRHLLASFANLPTEYKAVLAIDEAFLALIEGWMNPESVAPVPFAFRTHSAFRGAAQLALAGQVPEAFMVMRGCLENALYANRIDTSADALDAWMHRSDSEEARKRCVKAFTGRDLFAALRAREQQLGDIAAEMYERTIDYGAHPNGAAVFTSMAPQETESHTGYLFAYVSGDGLPLRFAIRSLSQVGLASLDVLCLVFPKRAAQQRVQERLAAVKPQF